jgi:hypothetical protein
MLPHFGNFAASPSTLSSNHLFRVFAVMSAYLLTCSFFLTFKAFAVSSQQRSFRRKTKPAYALELRKLDQRHYCRGGGQELLHG